jgi:predicted DNA-binding transcriptional regulator AlpA
MDERGKKVLRFIPMKDLTKEVNLSRAQIYKLIASGDFPPLVELTKTRRAARSDLVDLWKENRPFVTSQKGGICAKP